MDLIPSPGLFYATSAVLGLAVAGLTWKILAMAARPTVATAQSHEFETVRRIALRKNSATFRYLEPVVDELARWNESVSPGHCEQVGRALVSAAQDTPWRGSEYLAALQLEGAITGLAIGAVALPSLGFAPAMIFCVGIAAGYYQVMVRSLATKATERKRTLVRRLPFFVDLLALAMEAGAPFEDALRTAVRENEGHPLAEEFGRVLRDVGLGRPRADALRELAERVGDKDLSELVFSIVKGEELGTPLVEILRRQADQMRLKRSQWGEKAAGEAQIKLTFPGMIIMIACLVVIVVPVVLPLLSGIGG